MKISITGLGLVMGLVSSVGMASSADLAGKLQCTVTTVDKTPVYFLGPQGHFPIPNSTIALDLRGNTLSEDLEFEPFGRIPLKSIQTSLTRRDDLPRGEGVTYFDGQYVSPSKATYTLAIHIDPQGEGQLQIARRGFHAKLELYNAGLRCAKQP